MTHCWWTFRGRSADTSSASPRTRVWVLRRRGFTGDESLIRCLVAVCVGPDISPPLLVLSLPRLTGGESRLLATPISLPLSTNVSSVSSGSSRDRSMSSNESSSEPRWAIIDSPRGSNSWPVAVVRNLSMSCKDSSVIIRVFFAASMSSIMLECEKPDMSGEDGCGMRLGEEKCEQSCRAAAPTAPDLATEGLCVVEVLVMSRTFDLPPTFGHGLPKAFRAGSVT